MSELIPQLLELKDRGFRYALIPERAEDVLNRGNADKVKGVRTLGELFALPAVNKWSDDARTICVGLIGGPPPEYLLMAFVEDDTKWVIARVVDLTEGRSAIANLERSDAAIEGIDLPSFCETEESH